MTLPTPRRAARGIARRPLVTLTAIAGLGITLAGAAVHHQGRDPSSTTPAADSPQLAALVGSPELARSIDRYARTTPYPQLARQQLLDVVQRSSMCYHVKMSPHQADVITNQLLALPPGLIAQPEGLRYFSDTQVWNGNGGQSTSNRATPAQLTYSFPVDGTSWDGGGNVLNARLSTVFGAANVDKGRELIRQSLAGWRRVAGLTYTEVADNNSPLDNSITRTTARGDCRIGARPQDGVNGVLAYDYFPTGGSDMVLDADDFSGNFNNSSGNYLFLRNTVAHEHGHGLGYIHSVPCSNTKLMEPFEPQPFDMVQVDEVRGAQRNYGDRYAGNNSVAAARDFGDLTSPIVKSIVERDLSTNSTTGINNSDEDWFKFTLSSAQNVVITIDPTGGSYVEGQQTSGCTGTTATVNADQAGNLGVELRDSTGNTVLMSSTGAAAGVNEIITANGLAAGTYTVRVMDLGPNTTVNQFVQTYDMTIRVGTSKAPPQASAGVNKRIQAGTTCWFMGNINSRATESGASITTYAWDLDGDAVFEVANTAQPTRTYSVNGTYNVTLRITDSNGMTDTDTIQLVVFGGSSGVFVTSVSPPTGMQGTTVPVTLNGSGLGNLTSASNVTVSGTGVSVIGTPAVSGGTQVTGLSFVIDPAAGLGAHDVTVTTSDGSGTLSGGFTVNVNTVPSVSSVAPNFGRQGFTVPVTLNGQNLDSVTSASQVTVGGTGVSVIGTPTPINGNTQCTGLSFVIDAAAPSGPVFRSVSLNTPDGNATLVSGFRVRCLADWDGDFQLTPADVANFINNWSNDLTNGTLNADVDHNGVITPGDVAVFVNTWFNALSAGCP